MSLHKYACMYVYTYMYIYVRAYSLELVYIHIMYVNIYLGGCAQKRATQAAAGICLIFF